MKTKIIFIFIFLFINSFLYAEEKPKFVDTPDELSQALFKAIYENTFFVVPEQNGIFKENEKIIGEEREVKRPWQGSKIRKMESGIKDLVLYFKPDKIRKLGDVYLNPFVLKFGLSHRTQISVKKDNYKPVLLEFNNDKNYSIWIRSNNKSDIQIFLPRIKNLNQKTRGFLVCQRSYKEEKFSKNSLLEDVGYKIEAVKTTFDGETNASLLTSSSLNGRVSLSLVTTDYVSSAKIDKDESFGKSPSVSLTYFPEDSDKKDVLNDDNITMGLKYLYSMQYQSGIKRITDYTNYMWVKKENINFPLRVIARVSEEIKKLDLQNGNCYSVIYNAKIINTTYSKEEF